MSLGPPLRLLFVINSPIIGGAERHTFDLAEGLVEYGCRSTVFAVKNGPLEPPRQVTLLQPSSPRRLSGRVRDLARAITDERPDVLVSINERPVLVSWLGRLAARSSLPMIAVTHSTILNNTRQKLFQLLYTPLFNRADSVVFVSENQRAYWMSHGFSPRNETTILNGIDVGRFAKTDGARVSARRRHGFTDKDLVLGLCAVMRPEKNHLQLLEAVARLRAQNVEAKALLVGDGPRRPAIAARAKALGIEDDVVMVGMAADVRPHIAAFDIGVLCSVSIETLSLAALEIMAMGIPMVMSDLSGASEMIDGTNGRLFPVGDDAQFQRALLALRDPEVRRAAGSAARTSVEERFDRRTMIARYHRHFVKSATSRAPARSST